MGQYPWFARKYISDSRKGQRFRDAGCFERQIVEHRETDGSLNCHCSGANHD
jgi:hypothetical protein